MKQDLILFGIQGSGKGTQGRILAERLHLLMFETGAELRRLAKEESALGRKVKQIIEAGHLVPNEVVIEIIENFMNNIPKGMHVLFDGLPRSQPQKESFDALMKKLGRKPIGIVITLSKQQALERLLSRRMCKVCNTMYPQNYQKTVCKTCGKPLEIRKDDNEASIRNRLDAYEQETLPVISAYKKEGALIEVNGEQPIEAVTRDMMKALENC